MAHDKASDERKMKPRAVLLTGADLRHQFVAARLQATMDLVGIVRTPKRSATRHIPGDSVEERRVLDSHLAERASVEASLFSGATWPRDAGIIDAGPAEVNSKHVARFVEAAKPDVVLLYGTSIVKPPLLDFYRDRLVNMHLGLSPYYRGSGTNLWPLVDGLPECVGATIHLATAKVDGGPILVQVRPSGLLETDGPHEVGCRAIESGAAVLAESVPAFLNGGLTPSVQVGTGKLCRQADFNAAAVIEVRRRFAGGMIPAYLERQDVRDARFPIITARRARAQVT